jgi:predicted flavoprotein YhiN
MNERIKDLWQLAACYVNPLKTGGEWQAEFVEKFAELIAKECVMTLDEDDGATHHRELLFTHFGVEE